MQTCAAWAWLAFMSSMMLAVCSALSLSSPTRDCSSPFSLLKSCSSHKADQISMTTVLQQAEARRIAGAKVHWHITVPKSRSCNDHLYTRLLRCTTTGKTVLIPEIVKLPPLQRTNHLATTLMKLNHEAPIHTSDISGGVQDEESSNAA